MPVDAAALALRFSPLLLLACVTYQQRALVREPDPQTMAIASAGGKYSGLLVTFEEPDDFAQYGATFDWGYWSGRYYKGVGPLPAGYWVYVAPVWYVWERQASAPAAAAAPPGPCVADTAHCCLSDGRLVVPGGCQPDYPPGVQPATRRADDGRCEAVLCTLR